MKTIMVVDDESSVRASLKILLTAEKYEVIETRSADEAWEKLQKKKPDLILLDIMMPGMPSGELIEKIKKSTKLKSVKIIYLTAVMGAKEATKGTKGVVATLAKPYDNEELLSTIKKHIK